MRFSNIDLVWREERGWCVTMVGPSGEGGHLIPILDYIRGLHAFFGKPGTPFILPQRMLELTAADERRITGPKVRRKRRKKKVGRPRKK